MVVYPLQKAPGEFDLNLFVSSNRSLTSNCKCFPRHRGIVGSFSLFVPKICITHATLNTCSGNRGQLHGKCQLHWTFTLQFALDWAQMNSHSRLISTRHKAPCRQACCEIIFFE